MNDTKKTVNAVKETAFFKEAALLVGWIAGLVIVAGLIWFFTQPLRSSLLLKSVNQVLEQYGDSRRLGTPLPQGAVKTHAPGSWYTLLEVPDKQTGAKVFIFIFIGEGTFFPCAALLSPAGRVEEFLPLNSYGAKIIKELSPEILRLYTSRIEGSGS